MIEVFVDDSFPAKFFAGLDVDRSVVDEDSFFRSESKSVLEEAVNLRIWFNYVISVAEDSSVGLVKEPLLQGSPQEPALKSSKDRAPDSLLPSKRGSRE